MKATVEAFSRAYEEATPDEQAAFRAWMRNTILPGTICREDMRRIRRSEKESVEARDRRILEFPHTMRPRKVAQAVRAKGLYSSKTTFYHIEHRVRRLRVEARRIERNGSAS
ncbi:MAG TPA: hypothetical protein VIS99_00155 [Terrimicrobiaceae bacterium]